MKAHSTRGQIEEMRAALLGNGYQPVPVYGPKDGGKKPFGNKWQNATGMPKWHPDAPNTGINCHGLRAIDIDVDELDAEGIRALVVDRLGPAPIRTRSNSGRSLLLYRAAESEPGKRVVELDKKPPPPPGERPPRVDKIEVLGRGQQFVAYGTHETGVPLAWFDTSPLDTPRGELTAVTEEQIEALLGEIFDRFATSAARAGKTREAARTTSGPVMPVSDHRSLDRAWAEARLQGEMCELAQTGKGGRNDRLNLAVFNCARCVPLNLLTESEIEAAAEEACRMNGLAMDKESGGMSGVRNTFASAMKAGKDNPYSLDKVAARRTRSTGTEPAIGVPAPVRSRKPGAHHEVAIGRKHWLKRCLIDEEGRPIANLANVMIALRSDPALLSMVAYDEILRAPILMHPVPRYGAPRNDNAAFEPRPVTDTDVGELQEWLQLAGLPKIGKDPVHQAVDMLLPPKDRTGSFRVM
jgi:hypothetical protein